MEGCEKDECHCVSRGKYLQREVGPDLLIHGFRHLPHAPADGGGDC